MQYIHHSDWQYQVLISFEVGNVYRAQSAPYALHLLEKLFYTIAKILNPFTECHV